MTATADDDENQHTKTLNHSSYSIVLILFS